MPQKAREIEEMLKGKFGFTEAKSRSTDHRWYELRLEGLPVILTKLSHSKREIGTKLQGMIARQLRVRNAFFDGMMDCTNSSDDYRRQVRQDPVPPFDVRF
jgi:hypothetical protein